MKGQRELKCVHYHINGHLIADCWKLKRCDHCKLQGHSINNCVRLCDTQRKYKGVQHQQYGHVVMQSPVDLIEPSMDVSPHVDITEIVRKEINKALKEVLHLGSNQSSHVQLEEMEFTGPGQ